MIDLTNVRINAANLYTRNGDADAAPVKVPAVDESELMTVLDNNTSSSNSDESAAGVFAAAQQTGEELADNGHAAVGGAIRHVAGPAGNMVSAGQVVSALIEREYQQAFEESAAAVGAVAGAISGARIGQIAGSFVPHPAGRPVGAVVGTGVGAIGGSRVGRAIGEALEVPPTPPANDVDLDPVLTTADGRNYYVVDDRWFSEPNDPHHVFPNRYMAVMDSETRAQLTDALLRNTVSEERYELINQELAETREFGDTFENIEARIQPVGQLRIVDNATPTDNHGHVEYEDESGNRVIVTDQAVFLDDNISVHSNNTLVTVSAEGRAEVTQLPEGQFDRYREGLLARAPNRDIDSATAGAGEFDQYNEAPTAAITPNYQIQPGDTLSEIAGRFGVSVAELVQVNGIDNPNQIVAGENLLIPEDSSNAALLAELGINLDDLQFSEPLAFNTDDWGEVLRMVRGGAEAEEEAAVEVAPPPTVGVLAETLNEYDFNGNGRLTAAEVDYALATNVDRFGQGVRTAINSDAADIDRAIGALNAVVAWGNTVEASRVDTETGIGGGSPFHEHENVIEGVTQTISSGRQLDLALEADDEYGAVQAVVGLWDGVNNTVGGNVSLGNQGLNAIGIDASVNQVFAAVNFAMALREGDVAGIANSGLQLYTAFNGFGANAVPGLAYASAVISLLEGDVEGAAMSAATAYMVTLFPPWGAAAALVLSVFAGGNPPPPHAQADFYRDEDGNFMAVVTGNGQGLEEQAQSAGDTAAAWLNSFENSTGHSIDMALFPSYELLSQDGDTRASFNYENTGGGEAVNTIEEAFGFSRHLQSHAYTTVGLQLLMDGTAGYDIAGWDESAWGRGF